MGYTKKTDDVKDVAGQERDQTQKEHLVLG
jgi:hypothetical protein